MERFKKPEKPIPPNSTPISEEKAPDTSTEEKIAQQEKDLQNFKQKAEKILHDIGENLNGNGNNKK